MLNYNILPGLVFEPSHYHPPGSRGVYCWLFGVDN